jgi:hypothetical protein
MRLLILAAPALLAACAESIALTGGYLVAREAWRQGQPGRPWESITSGHEAPPPLPASLVPSRPDFVFTDEASGRDFELWFYHDHEVVADRVYVRDSGGDRRPATFDEARWAVSYYNAHWRHRTEAERMDYLSRPPAERQAIPAPLLNEHIRLREREVEELAKTPWIWRRSCGRWRPWASRPRSGASRR